VIDLLTDPISDYLTRIRNAVHAGQDEVEIPASRLKVEMSRILKEQGYINDFASEPARVGNLIRIRLKYTEARRPAITGLERVSRPGRRRYVDRRQVPRVHGGTGTAIVSTSRGVMTGHEATAQGVGGEVVAYIW
jgi:small subunit ribosomal protein S8